MNREQTYTITIFIVDQKLNSGGSAIGLAVCFPDNAVNNMWRTLSKPEALTPE
jgi:hypothetical protein